MAELTSTKIYGDLEVVRELKVDTLQSRSTDEIELKIVDGTLRATLNAEGYQIISGAAQAGSYGFMVQDTTYPTTDYQYLYWNNTSNYGGMFNRQGTSNSDLRQEYNYLRWYTSGSGGTSYQRFGCTTSEFTVNEDSNDMDFRVESNTNTHAIFMDGGNSFMGMNNSTPNCTLNIVGAFRLDDSSQRPNAGIGLEMYFDNSTGYIHPYDRTGASYNGCAMDIRGTIVSLNPVSGSTLRSGIDVQYSTIVFNEDGNDMNFRWEGGGTGKEYMIYGDAGTDQLHFGDIGLSATIANRLVGAEVTVGNERAWSTSPSSSVDNMFFYNYSRTAGDGVIGGSISLSGPAHGGTHTTSNRRHTVIGGIQGTTETDYVGITFWTHNSTSSTGAIQESMRLLYNGNLHVDQDVVAYSTVPSDIRIKKDITDLENPLEKILQLRGIEYTLKEDKGNQGRKIGYIAQEVEEIIPELVKEAPMPLKTGSEMEMFKMVKYSEAVPYITEAMKEQQAIIEDQQKEIDDLKEKVEFLMGKLS